MNPVPGIRRRDFLRATGIAGLGGATVGLLAPSPAVASPVAAGPADQQGVPYPTLRRPFAMPGVKDQDWSGALFVGEGEARFALRIGLLTETNKLLREKMTNNLWRIGPMAPDGSYKRVQISTDDRKIMPAHLDALREVIAHPDWWSAAEVADATAKLPVLEQQYALVQSQRHLIEVRYARTGDGDGLVGSVTAFDDNTTIVLEVSAPWTETPAFALAEDGVLGTEPGQVDPNRTGYFQLSPSESAEAGGCYASIADLVAAMTGGSGATGNAAAALRYTLRNGQTLTFRAAVAGQPLAVDPPDAHEVQAVLAAAEARVSRDYLTGSGAAGRAASAVRDALSLNTNYDRNSLRNFVMWGWGGGGGLFTGWDSAFDAIDAGLVSQPLATQHVADVFEAPAPPNQVPLSGPRYDQENSGPMHAYAVWRLYAKFVDRSLLEKTYPTLVTFYDLLPEWDADKDGLLESPYFGDRIGGRGNHLGLDDCPVYAAYERVPKQGGSGDHRDNTNLTDVALNSYYALMAETLAKMATVLGNPADGARFAAKHETIKQLLNDKLWHPERRLYLSRYMDGTWNEVVTPTVFYPLFGGIATPDRAEQLVQHLLDPDEFWGDYVIPSVARNDPNYCAGAPVHPQSEHFKFFDRYGEGTSPEQWQGAAWPPMNFTVYDGLKRYGFDDVAGEFAARSTAMYLDAWDKDNWFPESFDPIPGQPIMDSAVDTAWRTYSWSNAMAVQSLHELISDNPWGDPASILFGTLTLPGTNTIANVQMRGHNYAVSSGPHVTTLVRDGRVVFRATGARVAVRNFLLTSTAASFDVNADAPARIEIHPDRGRPQHVNVGSGRTHVEI